MNPFLKATIVFGVLALVGALTLGLGLLLSLDALRPNIEFEKYTVPEDSSVTVFKTDLDETDLNVVISDTATEISIEYPIKKTARGALANEISVDLADGVLSLTEKCYWYRSLFVIGDDAEITLTLPKDALLSYEIGGATSDVTLPTGLCAEDISVSLSTADVSIGSETRAQSITVALTTGDVEMGSAVVGGNVSISTTTGEITLRESLAAEHITLSSTTGDTAVAGDVLANSFKHKTSSGDLEVGGEIRVAEFTSSFSTGDLEVDGLIDAGDVRIDGRTGDVSLVLLGSREDYTASTSTSTGDNNVGSYSGGERRLEITLSTGDIYARFVK